MRKVGLLAVAGLLGLAANAAIAADFDFGEFVQQQLKAKSRMLFGVVGPLEQSSTSSVTAAQAQADPTSLVTVANGLRVRTVSAAGNLGANTDMIALWPNDWSPTHLITCNEEGPAQPGVQRVDLMTGAVATILTGTSSCDPIRRTPWGTIIVGEEVSPPTPGWVLEIINLLGTTGVLFNRTTGALTGADAANVTTRPAVGRLAFEGIALYQSGVMYYGGPDTGVRRRASHRPVS